MLKQNFIEAVYERDIDLLLIEDFHANPAFRNWFANQVFDQPPHSLEFKGAWHSVVESGLGESDIIVVQSTAAGERLAILIENKIDAAAQPEQAKRYIKRGQIGIEKDYWDFFQTCLLAPDRYLTTTANAQHYDRQISYEAIRDWLNEAAEGDAEDVRLRYKARLLDEAIEHNRRGYQPVPHEMVTRFWHHYWEFVQSAFPQLYMNRPGSVPANSDWPVFTNPEFGRTAKIVHKLRFGFVDLQLGNQADRVEGLILANRSFLPDDVEVVQAGKSAAFRIIVPSIDRFKEFTYQIDGVRIGLEAADRLLALFPRLKGL